MKDNLILIGMPGAGKSTIGVILAKTLAMDFVDGDLEICKETGTTLQDILDHQGKDAFLEIENRVICGLNPHHTVVATGGSVPLEPEAMGHMKEIGTVIYLKVGLEELRNRLSNIKTRGIASMPSVFPFMRAGQRSPLRRIPIAMILRTWWIRSWRSWSGGRHADADCNRKAERALLPAGSGGI